MGPNLDDESREVVHVILPKFIAGAVVTLSATSFAAAAERWMEIPEPAAMPAAAESGYAPVNGIEMYYAVYGAGEPVLLIHGGLGHADVWASQVMDLIEGPTR